MRQQGTRGAFPPEGGKSGRWAIAASRSDPLRGAYKPFVCPSCPARSHDAVSDRRDDDWIAPLTERDLHPRQDRRRKMLLETIRVCIAAVILLAAVPKAARAPAQAAPITPTKNIVLVHGAWVDGSGWKPVYEILVRDGYHVSIVQEPLTSLPSDVATTMRVIDLQSGPGNLGAYSLRGSVVVDA